MRGLSNKSSLELFFIFSLVKTGLIYVELLSLKFMPLGFDGEFLFFMTVLIP